MKKEKFDLEQLIQEGEDAIENCNIQMDELTDEEQGILYLLDRILRIDKVMRAIFFNIVIDYIKATRDGPKKAMQFYRHISMSMRMWDIQQDKGIEGLTEKLRKVMKLIFK